MLKQRHRLLSIVLVTGFVPLIAFFTGCSEPPPPQPTWQEEEVPQPSFPEREDDMEEDQPQQPQQTWPSQGDQ